MRLTDYGDGYYWSFHPTTPTKDDIYIQTMYDVNELYKTLQYPMGMLAYRQGFSIQKNKKGCYLYSPAGEIYHFLNQGMMGVFLVVTRGMSPNQATQFYEEHIKGKGYVDRAATKSIVKIWNSLLTINGAMGEDVLVGDAMACYYFLSKWFNCVIMTEGVMNYGN